MNIDATRKKDGRTHLSHIDIDLPVTAHGVDLFGASVGRIIGVIGKVNMIYIFVLVLIEKLDRHLFGGKSYFYTSKLASICNIVLAYESNVTEKLYLGIVLILSKLVFVPLGFFNKSFLGFYI